MTKSRAEARFLFEVEMAGIEPASDRLDPRTSTSLVNLMSRRQM